MTHAQKRALAMFLTIPVVALSAFATEPSPFVSGELNVMPSPASTSELSLPAGSSVVDFDIWPTGPDAVILLHDSAGNHVVSWHAGGSGNSFPVSTSHKRTVLSSVPVSTLCPSGDMATESTPPCPACTVNRAWWVSLYVFNG